MNCLKHSFLSSRTKKYNLNSKSYFVINSRGYETSRDAWIYNFSQSKLTSVIEKSVLFFNEQVAKYITAKQKSKSLKANDFIDSDPKNISWSSSLISLLEKGEIAKFDKEEIATGMYRPFSKQILYQGEKFIHRRGQNEDFFPDLKFENRVICVSGPGGVKPNTCLITNLIPDLNCLDAGTQCFPLYYYEPKEKIARTLFDANTESSHIRRDGITDFIQSRARDIYGKKVTKEDIFYYVYGILHSPNYRDQFSSDLKKMLPRIPLVEEPKSFWKFSKAGRQLADLHIGYEDVSPAKEVMVHFGKTSQVDINQATEFSGSENPQLSSGKDAFSEEGPERHHHLQQPDQYHWYSRKGV